MQKQYESWHLVWGIVINSGFYVQKILKEKRMGCCRRPASSFSFVQIENMGMPIYVWTRGKKKATIGLYETVNSNQNSDSGCKE